MTWNWQKPNMSGASSCLRRKFSHIQAQGNAQRFLNLGRSEGGTHPLSWEEFPSNGVVSVKQGSMALELQNWGEGACNLKDTEDSHQHERLAPSPAAGGAHSKRQ